MNKPNWKIIAVMLFIVTLIGFVSSHVHASSLEELPNGEPFKTYTISQTCIDSTYITISIKTPNQTIYRGISMSNNNNGDFSYAFNNTILTGRYDVTGISDGCDKTFATYFCIGSCGGEGNVIIFFSIGFLIIIGFLIYELIVGLGHFASLDLDAVDLAKSMGTYFALLGLYWLGSFYLINPIFDRWLLIFVSIGGFTHVIVPIIGFVLSITIGSLKKKNVDFGTGRIYRRHQDAKV